jgi:chaperonin GroES
MSQELIRMIGTKVLVVKLREKPRSNTIILEDTVSERESGKAFVVSVGTGSVDKHGEKIPLDVSPGDVVLLKPYVGAPWEGQGVSYHVIEAADILAVYPGGGNECT